MPDCERLAGSVSLLNWGFRLDLGTVRISTSSLMLLALNKPRKASRARVECPIVHIDSCPIKPIILCVECFQSPGWCSKLAECQHRGLFPAQRLRRCAGKQ